MPLSRRLHYAILTALAGLVIAWAWSSMPVLDAQSTLLWRMNIASGAHPNYGFSSFDPSQRNGVQWTITFVAGGGPGGRDAVQVQFIPLAAGGFGANVWEGTPGVSAPPQGAARYIRYYIYYSNVTNLRRSQDSDFWGVKTTLIDASPDTQRAIETSAPHTAANNLQIRWGKNIDGPPHETVGDPFLNVGWNAVQLGIFMSTTTSSGNGGYRVWRNNDNFSSPSAASAFSTSQNGSAMGGLGLLVAMEPLKNTASLTMRIAAFEYDDAFDPQWSARMGTGGGPTAPMPPHNLAIVR